MKSDIAFNRRDRAWLANPETPDAINFHRSLAEYAPSELMQLPTLAADLGIGVLLAKNESKRIGLPAFKALGASWAINKSLAGKDGVLTFVTATDGNHGRAIARFSRLLGHKAKIVIPPGVHENPIQAIRDEGAEVEFVTGTYDDAVARAAEIAEQPNHFLVQDTAWDGYEEVPTWIVEGYATMFNELDSQLAELGITHPDLVIVPAGVGSLLQAALWHYRSKPELLNTAIASVEPDSADCVLQSVKAGDLVAVKTTTTVMSGLNCGTVSSLAWPYIKNGLNAAISVTDKNDIQAAHDLAALGIPVGPCGAAGLAGLRVALEFKDLAKLKSELNLHEKSVVVLLITEGPDANPVPTLY